MSTITKSRRHDDYRPASLRRFWQWLFRLWWDFEDAMSRWYDYAVLLVLFVAALLLIVGAGVLAALIWG